jgi:hypothetical protein
MPTEAEIQAGIAAFDKAVSDYNGTEHFLEHKGERDIETGGLLIEPVIRQILEAAEQVRAVPRNPGTLPKTNFTSDE